MPMNNSAEATNADIERLKSMISNPSEAQLLDIDLALLIPGNSASQLDGIINSLTYESQQEQ